MKFADFLKNRQILNNGYQAIQPKISVVLPTYNREKEGLLKPCLDSIFAQTFDDFELIILDDNSTDGTGDLIRSYAAKDPRVVAVFHDQNSGLPAVRTDEGILLARGEYIAFVFDDNLWQPDALKILLAEAQRSGAEMVVGQVSLQQGNRNQLLGTLPFSQDLFYTFNSIPNGAVLCQRTFFDKYGLYDPHLILRRICDWDLWLRALIQGAFIVSVPQPLGVEKGVNSTQSLGNTVRWDKKVALAYMTDQTRARQRTATLRPESIKAVDPFDPEVIVRYVRDLSEWERIESTVYTPYLEKHLDIDTQPLLRHNHRYDRALSDDALNPQWPLFNDRKRILFIANRFDREVREWWSALQQDPNHILVGTNEMAATEFFAADFDIILMWDVCSPALLPFIKQCNELGLPVINLVLHGMDGPGVDTDAVGVAFSKNKAMLDHFQSAVYFSHPGLPWDTAQLATAKTIMDNADQTFSIGAYQREGLTPVEFVMNSIPAVEYGSDVSLHIYLGNGTRPASALKSALEHSISSQAAGKTCLYSNASQLPEWLSGFAGRLNYRQTAETLPNLVEQHTGALWLTLPDILAGLTEHQRRLMAEDLARRGSILLPLSAEKKTTPADEIQQAVVANQDLQLKSSNYRADARWLHLWNIVMGVVVRKKAANLRRLDHARDVHCAGMINSQLLGGSEIYGLLVVRSLVKLGFNFSVYYPKLDQYSSGSGNIYKWAEENNLPKPQAVEYGRCTLELHAQGFLEQDLLSYAENLRKWLNEQQVGLLFLSGFISEPLISPEPSRLVYMGLFPPWGYNLQRLTFARDRLDGLVSDSAWAAKIWGEWIAPPVTPVYSLIGRDFFTVQNAHLPASPVQIAVVGTMIATKRQKEILLAFQQLVAEGYPVRLNFYGHDLKIFADYSNELRTIVAGDPALEASVTFNGFVSDPNEILKNNHVILSASGEESIPQGVLFHQAGGMLPIACPAGGLEELVRDGETGYVVDGFGVDEIAQALRRALQNQARWPELIARGRDILLQNCSEEWFAHLILCTMLDGAVVHASEGNRYFSDNSLAPVKTLPRRRKTTIDSDISCYPVQPSRELETTQMKIGPDLGKASTLYTFKTDKNRLSGIQLKFGTYRSALQGSIQIELRSSGNQTPLRKFEISADILADNAWVQINFPPIRNSLGHEFILDLKTNLEDGRIALYETTSPTTPSAGWVLPVQRRLRRYLAFKIKRPGQAIFPVYADRLTKD